MAEKNYTGTKFGRLTVLQEAPTRKHRRYFLCRCECGTEREVLLYSLTSGHTRSCGCLHKKISARCNTKHGDSYADEYQIWCNMIYRCTNPKSTSFKNYGGRGIRVCDRWRRSYTAFLQDVGRRPTPNHSIDRINNNGDYEPNNVRWATEYEQSQNRRTLSTNKSGFTGVHYCKRSGKWRAQINRNGARHYLGYFITKSEAIAARKTAEMLY